MIKQFLVLLFFLFIAFESEDASSKEVYYGNHPELINLLEGGKTIFRFQGLVKTILPPIDFKFSAIDKTNPNYSEILVEPIGRRKRGRATIVLDNGDVIRLSLRSVKSSQIHLADSVYDLKPKRDLISSGKSKEVDISPLDLMKAMIKGHSVSGFKIEHHIRNIPSIRKGLKAKLFRIYRGKRYSGFIIGVTNISKNPIRLNVKGIRIGNGLTRVQVQSDRKVIPSKSSPNNFTMVRLVAKSTSSHRHLVLPTAILKNKGEE